MPVKLTKVFDHTAGAVAAISELSQTRVMIGVPAEKAGREQTEAQPINNATLMYIHEHGAPEANIPARPVLYPAAAEVQKTWVPMLKRAAEYAMKGDRTSMMNQFHAIGLLGQNAMRKRITDGPFIPLKPATLAARRAKGRTGTKPLIDTGQLRRALTYVIRRVLGLK